MARKRNVFQTRRPSNEMRPVRAEYSHDTGQAWRHKDNRSRWEREPQPPLQQREGPPRNANNRPYIPPARRNYVNAVQQADDEWPQENEEGEITEPTPTVAKRSASSQISAPPTWLFTVFCLITTVGISSSQMRAKPMLCQSHAAQQIFQLPELFNCTFILKDDRPAPLNATLQLYRQNIVKYRTTAYLCMRTETTIQRMTYFAAVNHREKQTTRHVTVSRQECSEWIRNKKTDDGPLVYTNKMWYTTKKAQVYWPNIFQCCQWKTFRVNNSFILRGKVIKDHNHKMHSSLGDWRHCEYHKGSCQIPNGAQTRSSQQAACGEPVR